MGERAICKFITYKKVEHILSSQDQEGRIMERDKNGFLNCKKCSRRFFPKVGFQNHLSTLHGSIVIEAPQTMDTDASTLPDEKVDKGLFRINCNADFI